MRLFFNESIKRGLVQLVRRQLYWLVMIVLPIGCSIFLLDLMKDGGVHRVPVGIVDLDNSMVSRRIERNLMGMQQVDIVDHYTDYRAALDAVQRGDIYGFILIPDRLEHKALSGQEPVVSYYVNYAYSPPYFFIL